MFMVLSIARQSVVIKCNLDASVMTGNYEFYYASGLLYQLAGQQVDEVPEPLRLQEEIQPLLEEFTSEDARELHLVHMLRYYKPVESFDEQMRELFLIGYRERNLWQELSQL